MTIPNIAWSLLLPTRRRVALATRSLLSIHERCTKPEQLEVVFAVDQDDADSAHQLTAWCEHQRLAWQLWLTPRRGYARLHEYENGCAALARGKLLWIWNDDLLMQTPGWDKHLNPERFVVSDPRIVNANQERFRYGLFPIVPKAWFEHLGHLSMHPANDTYIFDVADRLGIHERAEIDVFHDRFYETGFNDDETFQEGRSPDAVYTAVVRYFDDAGQRTSEIHQLISADSLRLASLLDESLLYDPPLQPLHTDPA